ncbi:hypothetical protein P6E99_004295, partial [Salmonella enterica]|nr:hypothetical protein [Salmonella enterica]
PYLDEGENGVTPVCAYDGDIVTTRLALPGVYPDMANGVPVLNIIYFQYVER